MTPRTQLELSFNYQDRPYYRRTLTSMTWTYSWSNEKYSSFAVRPVDLNLVDMSYINQDFFEKLQNLYLRNSYTSQLVAGISGSYTYNNQLKNPGRNATLVRFNWETAGNLIGGWNTSSRRRPKARTTTKFSVFNTPSISASI